MHKVVVPKNSGIHRFACLALYRALLRQCSASALAAPWRNETKSLVQNRFRRYQGLESPSQVSNALKAGYKTLDLLDSAMKGNKSDASRVNGILAQARMAQKDRMAAQREMNKTKPVKVLSPKQARKKENVRLAEATRRRHPNTASVLARPYPEVSGKRGVPVLVNARGVPFLRIKKPQPSNLGGVLRAKLEKRWKCIEARDRLYTDHLFAKDEDEWDGLTDAREHCKWTEEVSLAQSETFRRVRKFDHANKAMADKMWKVVLKERTLAAQERSQTQQSG
ncbi:hypothetical protein N7492_001234 [Penicillium capsulatum]|uniref:Complex 1 LYR protein domain-containing protein n=1 Tax=Penicillium capsulatum TaxID=69766 RepID=A0A9W9ISU4_9EURO|nr:hypothetical protein N7492_001234 [Penicillium capsulatum]KAJ6129708.1 hypothetical protein N7512_002488 [Penicillium capsulatum]